MINLSKHWLGKLIAIIGVIGVLGGIVFYQLSTNFTGVLLLIKEHLYLWPILPCGSIFALGRELMEHSRDNRWPINYGEWWNSNTGWKNKHSWQPSWLFSTALVWLTDAEHFFQMVSTLGAFTGVLLAAHIGSEAPLITAIVFYFGNAVFGIIKETLLKNVQ